jgi:hypothetical protein
MMILLRIGLPGAWYSACLVDFALQAPKQQCASALFLAASVHFTEIYIASCLSVNACLAAC